MVIIIVLSLVAGALWNIARTVFLAAASPGEKAARMAQWVQSFGALEQILIALISMGGAALMLSIWRHPVSASERQTARQAIRQTTTWMSVIAVGVLMFLSSSLVSWAGTQWGLEPHPSNLAPLQDLSRNWPVFTTVFTIILAPFYEELLFRRVLFGGMWRAGYPRLGMLLSGVTFALAHEVPGLNSAAGAATVLLLLIYTGMGMAFAWLYRRTGTVWAPVVAHALNNALALAFLHLVSGGR